MSSSDDSLASLLTAEQRRDFASLVASTAGQMRTSIIQGFQDDMPNRSGDDEQVSQKAVQDEAMEHSATSEGVQSYPDHSDLSVPEFHKLRSASLAFFDAWRERVVHRVNEVLTAESRSSKHKDPHHTQRVANAAAKEELPSTPSEKAATDAISAIYPPIPTPLANLGYGERLTALNAVLLLLLSLETYTAHSRTLLLRLSSSLHIPVGCVTRMEKDIAIGLLTAASHMDASSSTTAAQEANVSARKWKVGLASVAGAALIGITGGLAAPLVAAGVGGLMGGLGLGATAAAGYLGTLAGSGVLVGSLFGAYGGRMSGKMIDEYAREVEDFRFLPLNDEYDENLHRLEHLSRRMQGHNQDAEKDSEKRRLSVTIGISGWLTKKSEAVTPWHVLGSEGGEPFALRWEIEALLHLGRAIQGAVKSYAWSYIRVELLKRTALAGLMAATWPLSFLKFSKVLDNPFSIAKSRADKAGAILADAIINKAQGERPVSLVGYSLGGRVIYSCLKTLAERKAFGLIDSVVVMGAPIPSDVQDWKIIRSVVIGRLVNVYSENDYILGFLYRTSSVQFGVAGLQPVDGVHGVENLDVSATVTGHLRYRHMVGQLLRQVGWPNLDEKAIEAEMHALKKLQEEEERIEEEVQREGREEDGKGDDLKQAEMDSQRLQEEFGEKMKLEGKDEDRPRVAQQQ